MYCFESRIRYSEVDSNGILTVGNMINYLQDCSTFQSEDLGIGIRFLKERKEAWILNSWQIDLLELPYLGDSVVIGTWAYDFKGIYGYRNFLIKGKDGKELVKANSVWVYLNLETGKPIKVTEENRKGYEILEPLEMEYLPRKVVVPSGGSVQEPIVVQRHHIDTNQHVNNGQYIQLALDYLPEQIRWKQLRAEYRKAAVLGDVMIPRILPNDRNYFVVMEDKEGNPYVNMEFIGTETGSMKKTVTDMIEIEN